MIDFIDKTSEQNGTPINRENMMAVQGFNNKNISIDEDENGNIVLTEVDPKNNHTLNIIVTENEDGSITVSETFVGEKTISKSTTIDRDAENISEVVL